MPQLPQPDDFVDDVNNQFLIEIEAVDSAARRFLHYYADDAQHAQEQALDEDPTNSVIAVFQRIL